MERIKQIFIDPRQRDYFLRWAVRVTILALVLYIALLKDKSKETVFIKPDEAHNRLIVIDHIIIEGKQRDSIIKSKYENIDYTGAGADSLYRIITKHLKR